MSWSFIHNDGAKFNPFPWKKLTNDLKAVNVPALVIHGDADQTVPLKESSARTVEMLRAPQYLVYEGAPHGLFVTDKDRLNRDLVQFVNGI
ncbi:alpha/beta fold hydrolase [Noviherbaspirillum aerium]|uniref:alpha/beta fold hydrolase n=1 Tax=Noviherbaspirillum aerium TaxID=2588497 RepID=UPI00124C9B7B|nr:alpha/beta hydrolase [Noviherbaspirillum aerium]